MADAHRADEHIPERPLPGRDQNRADDHTPERLPRGRHRLTREQVARSQRGRMLRALAEAMTEKGYVGTSVAEIIRRAGVSRETFYEQFSSKEACFAGAYDAAAALLLVDIDAAAAATDEPYERFARVLEAYIERLAAEPAYARVFLIEVYAAGPVALERRAELQGRFVDRLAGLLDARAEHERFACEMLVAAISSLVTTRLAAGDLEGLRSLRAPILELVRHAWPGVPLP